jgi:hypothetical protein
MYTVEVTHYPSGYGRDGAYVRTAFDEPRTFGGFRSRTGRRAASLYGSEPEVTYASDRRKPAGWLRRDSAERAVETLERRGYTARVVGEEPVPAGPPVDGVSGEDLLRALLALTPEQRRAPVHLRMDAWAYNDWCGGVTPKPHGVYLD